MDSPEKAVVLVHGSWHTPAHYDKLTSLMRESGYLVKCPLLPTSNNSIPPTASLSDDTSLVRNTVHDLCTAGHSIIVLMHSYGGIVGTNALRDLSYTHRESQGLPGGVVHLIYMCAFILPLHANLVTPFGGLTPPFLTIHTEIGTVDMRNPRRAFYSDLSEEEAEYWLKQTVACPASVLADSLSYAAYEKIRSTYLVCEGDIELPKAAQEGMAALLGSGRRMEYCSAGHSPFLSMPGRVMEVLKECGKAVVNGHEGE